MYVNRIAAHHALLIFSFRADPYKHPTMPPIEVTWEGHSVTIHASRAGRYACPDSKCPRDYSSLGHLMNHLRTKNPEASSSSTTNQLVTSTSRHRPQTSIGQARSNANRISWASSSHSGSVVQTPAIQSPFVPIVPLPGKSLVQPPPFLLLMSCRWCYPPRRCCPRQRQPTARRSLDPVSSPR